MLNSWTVSSPLHRWESRGSVRLTDLPKTSELGSEYEFSGLKRQPLSPVLPPPMRTTWLLGDSKPVVTMGTGLMWKVERVGVQAAVGRLQVGGLHGLCPVPPMKVALDFRLWGLGSRFWVPSGRCSVTRPGSGVMLVGYPQCCLRKPRALVKDVIPNRFPHIGRSHACSADRRAELSQPRRNERKKRQDHGVGGAQSHAEGSRPGQNVTFLTCKRGMILAPLPQTLY